MTEDEQGESSTAKKLVCTKKPIYDRKNIFEFLSQNILGQNCNWVKAVFFCDRPGTTNKLATETLSLQSRFFLYLCLFLMPSEDWCTLSEQARANFPIINSSVSIHLVYNGKKENCHVAKKCTAKAAEFALKGKLGKGRYLIQNA